jgi:hypothetical protein
MKEFKLLFIFTSLLPFASCNNENEDSAIQSEVEVKFVSQILTRATNNQWETNDQIGLFMYQYGQKLSKTSVYNNAANCKFVVATSGELQPATDLDKIYYPLNENVNFIAYYPFCNAEEYSVNLDVSKQKDLSAIDFLYSNNLNNIAATATPQQLNFTHQLSKVVFNIKPNTSISKDELKGGTITIRNAVSNATFSLVEGSITLGTQKKDLTIPITIKDEEGYAEGIMIPQQCENMYFVISLPLGKSYFFTMKDDNIWTSTQKYTYEVQLSESPVNASLNATISDWTDGETGGIEDITTSQKWDGISANTQWYTDEDDTYTLYQPADLAGLAKLVNEGINMNGKTIYLSSELDMNNKPWIPIGISDDTAFKGTFNGNYLTIKNLNPALFQDANTAGLFGVSEGVIQNLQVNGDFQIEYHNNNILYAGGICSINKGTIQHCRSHVNMVVHMKYESDQQTNVYAGGIVGDHLGILSSCQNYGSINAENINTNTNAYLHIGGIAGGASNGATITNCENTRNLTGENGNIRIGGIVGISSGNSVSVTNCSNIGKILIEASHNETAAGGIIGKNSNQATVKGVYNQGNVSVKLTDGSKAYGGGVIGMNDAATLLSGENQGEITVVGSGKDGSASAAGGIVGYNINAATIHKGVNNGSAIASNATYCFSGGITGFNNSEEESVAYTYDCCTNTGTPILWIGNATTANNLITNTEHMDE